MVVRNNKHSKRARKGTKIYSAAKEIAKANLAFCCLQEVRWRSTGSEIITLDTGKLQKRKEKLEQDS